jgi:hypothetical protein
MAALVCVEANAGWVEEGCRAGTNVVWRMAQVYTRTARRSTGSTRFVRISPQDAVKAAESLMKPLNIAQNA